MRWSLTDPGCAPASSRDSAGLPLPEDQPLDVVGQVGEPDLHPRSRQSDCADEQPHAALLLGKDMLNAGPHLRLAPVGAPGSLRHWAARRLFAMDVRREAV